MKAGVAQSCPTLCDPRNCSSPGFSVHGILQARILEWAARYGFNLGTVGFKSWQDVQLEFTSLQVGQCYTCMRAHTDARPGDALECPEASLVSHLGAGDAAGIQRVSILQEAG